MQPNFKLLGPLLGKDLPEVKKLLMAADGSQLSRILAASGELELTLADGRSVTLTDEQIQRRLLAQEGWAAAEGKQCVVVLATELTASLIREGLVRDLVRFIQDRRKESGCEYTDRIHVGVVTDSEELREAVREYSDYIKIETLTDELLLEPLADTEPTDVKIGDNLVQLDVARVKTTV